MLLSGRNKTYFLAESTEYTCTDRLCQIKTCLQDKVKPVNGHSLYRRGGGGLSVEFQTRLKAELIILSLDPRHRGDKQYRWLESRTALL